MPAIETDTILWECRHCHTYQNVYIGDKDDMTLPDVEALRCYACKNLELTYEDHNEFNYSHNLYAGNDDLLPITQELIAEHAYIEDGRPIK